MIPDTARAPVDRGIVVAVGPGRRTQAGTLIPLAVTPGDEVMLARGSGTDVTLDGEQFVVVHERDVLGVLVPQVPQVRSEPGADVLAESIRAPAHELGGTRRKESLETDVAPDLLDREAPTGDDLH